MIHRTTFNITLATLLLLTSCLNKNKPSEQKNRNTPTLISWSNEFVMKHSENDYLYYDDHKNFINDYFSVNYHEKQIIATTLIEVNCIDSIIGKIDVSNDTIYLIRDILMTDDRVCSEFHKFTFTISNPNDNKYKIISVK